jgi:thioredoxin 2
MERSSLHLVCPHCLAVNRIPADRPALRAKCGTCHRPLFEGRPFPVTTESFERHRTRNDIPLVVDFWAPWCGPCRAMGPAFERAAGELEPGYRLLKVNIDEEPALAERYGVHSIPLLMLFAHGEPAVQTAGAMSTAGIVAWVRGQGRERQPTQAASAGG